jgi:hypothetical protein
MLMADLGFHSDSPKQDSITRDESIKNEQEAHQKALVEESEKASEEAHQITLKETSERAAKVVIDAERKEREKRLKVLLETFPNPVSFGERTQINVTIQDGYGRAIKDVKVQVSAGGGKFLKSNEEFNSKSSLQSPYESIGLTDEGGVYTTWWVCNPCAAGYGMNVKVSKDNYYDTNSELTINIK